MAEPTKKSFPIENLLSSISGEHRPTMIKGNKCVICKGDAKEFKDAISEKEYTISGLCQKCQDKAFD